MKIYCLTAILTLLALLSGCGGQSSADAVRQQQRQDSIAKAKAEEERRIADSIAVAEAKIEAERKERLKEKAKEDSIEIASLLPQFSCIENSENKDTKLYVAKGISLKHQGNRIYLSFKTFDDKPRDLLINADCCGSDWLMPKNAVITLDGESFDVVPGDTGSDVYSDLSCHEWFSADCPYGFTEKLKDAKEISVKLIGESDSRTIKLSKKDLDNMKKTARLYELLNR